MMIIIKKRDVVYAKYKVRVLSDSVTLGQVRCWPPEQVTDISVLNGSYKLQFETSKSKLMIIFTLIYRKLPQREATQVIKTHRYVQNKPKKSSGE